MHLKDFFIRFNLRNLRSQHLVFPLRILLIHITYFLRYKQVVLSKRETSS